MGSKNLLSLGHGFSARAFGDLLIDDGWQVCGTTRDRAKFAALETAGVTPILWERDQIQAALPDATALLISTAPNADGCPALAALAGQSLRHLNWIGYLSTTGVYGDHQGGWVDEDTPLSPSTKRGQMRVTAEAGWQALAEAQDLPLHIFRLAGIYGPGRGPFAKVRAGTARRILKPGQVFSRIHVADIAQVLQASLARPNPGRVYNLCDDDPAPPEDVIAHAAELLGLPLPAAEDFETAEMTPMARSFYAESKRVRNDRIKTELGVRLKYPNYRVGLKALLEAEASQ